MFEQIKGNSASVRCPDRACRGNARQEASVTTRIRVWTRQVGGGPITIGRVERLPIEIPERHQRCQHCGGKTEVTWLGLDWPVPKIPDGFSAAHVDEVLPAPPAPPTLEQRVAELEARAG